MRLGVACTIPKTVPRGRPTRERLLERARLAELAAEGEVAEADEDEGEDVGEDVEGEGEEVEGEDGVEYSPGPASPVVYA